MTIAKDNGRQYSLIAKVSFGYADFGASGVAEAAVDMPPNSTVIGGELVIETAFNSATSDVIDVGDGVDTDRYSATPVNATVAARSALDLTGFKYTGKDTVDLEWTGVGAAPTQGSGYLLIEYVIDNRANENQPA